MAEQFPILPWVWGQLPNWGYPGLFYQVEGPDSSRKASNEEDSSGGFFARGIFLAGRKGRKCLRRGFFPDLVPYSFSTPPLPTGVRAGAEFCLRVPTGKPPKWAFYGSKNDPLGDFMGSLQKYRGITRESRGFGTARRGESAGSPPVRFPLVGWVN